MARSRNIKPGFFTNDLLVELPVEFRLLFIGIWTIADREGRLCDRHKKIKMEVFPADNVDCERGVSLLIEKGFIRKYEVDGCSYLQVVNWHKHQSPHCKEKQSVIPAENGVRTVQAPVKHGVRTVQAPVKHGASTVQAPDNNGTSTSVAHLIPDSFNLIPDSTTTTSNEVVVDSKLPTCPQQEILKLYEEILPELPQPRMWDGARATALTARWRAVLKLLKNEGKTDSARTDDGLDYFSKVFLLVKKSDFLMGRKTEWTASLGWIVKAENFAKIIDGNYDQ